MSNGPVDQQFKQEFLKQMAASLAPAIGNKPMVSALGSGTSGGVHNSFGVSRDFRESLARDCLLSLLGNPVILVEDFDSVAERAVRHADALLKALGR